MNELVVVDKLESICSFFVYPDNINVIIAFDTVLFESLPLLNYEDLCRF